jgi:bifunctional hydroxylase/dehydrase
MDRSNFDHDVIIVGAGPTGLMLAGELGLAGVSVVVLDRLIEPMRHSRALGFSARTIEEFDQRGLLALFGDVGTIPVGHFGGIPLDYRVLAGGSYGVRGIPQTATEAMLANWAIGLGAEVRRGHEVVDLEASDDGVEVEVSTPDGTQRLRAAYLVGCDGGGSTVRKLAGIDFPGTEPVIEMWLADVRGPALRPRFSGERVPGGMVMVLPVAPDVSRVVVYERGAPPRHSQEPPTFAAVADAWQRLTGEDIHGGTPRWVSWFTDASRQATDYRRGRVFLAGDAAHVHLPIGGQGMSAGIQDAVNLGWKLAEQVHGHAAPDLLDTYHSERHPVGARIVANTLTQRILYLSGDEMQPLRDIFAELMTNPDVQQHLVGMVTGLDISYDVGPGEHPLLGRRMPNVELVNDESGKSSVYEHLHGGRGLLLDLADDPAVRAAADGWTDRVTTVTAIAHRNGFSHRLADARAALVRPDGYTAWIGSAPADGLRHTFARWFGPARQGS